VNDVIAFVDSSLQADFNGPRGFWNLSEDSFKLVLDPSVLFKSESSVTVRAVSASLDGAHILEESWSFVIEDRTAPRIISASATSSKTVRLTFNEAVTVTDPSGFSFVARQFPAAAVEPAAATADDTVANITLDTEMTPGVQYELTVTGVVDLNANPPDDALNTVLFIGFKPPVPAGRRFRLWEMIPKHNRRQDDTGDLKRFIACLQEVTDLLLSKMDSFVRIFDIERASESFLDLILRDLGNPFVFDLSALEKARLASVLIELYRQKGTEVGIVNAIRFFLEIEVKVLPLTADLLGLGEAALGVDWILGPSDRAALYSFNVSTEQELTDVERYQIRTVVEYMKPAHTHFVMLIENKAETPDDAWELGIGAVGIETRLG
jgi:phage tail-like protein